MKSILFTALLVVLFFIGNKTAFAQIEITDARSTPEYWLDRNANGDEIILTSEKISELNEQMLERDKYSADLANYPEKIKAKNLKAQILKLTDDVKLNGTEAVMANRNLNALTDVKVLYAVTLERVNIRLLPQAFSGDRYDPAQGTALDPAEPVAVLWTSKDGKFVFAQSRNYFGWIDKNQLAFTDKVTWLRYVQPENFVVVVNNKKFVNIAGKVVRFQMGAVIPLVDDTFKDNAWTAYLPVSVNGELREVTAKIPNDGNVNLGWLDCTENNFVRQGFKFLGDVYGWGGLDNSVDCSAFVGDVYRSMGINIPRDADKQEGAMPIFAVFNNVTHDERVDIANRAPTGALFFKPGHVMMKLGNDENGETIMIHAASSYFSEGYKIYVRKVLVSDLSYENAAGVPTIDCLTGIAIPK